MSTPYLPPTYEATAFNCPHCGAFAKQTWLSIYYVIPKGENQAHNANGHRGMGGWQFSECEHCHELSCWHDGVLEYPHALSAAPHHDDMPADVATDYDEAREILANSPRSSAALLRLALQRLMPHLGVSTGNLNNDIGALVQQGLPLQVQQALDTVRVVGNNAVHPGEIDLNDDPETAARLFELLNFVVEDRIARPKAIGDLFAGLPAGARDAVSRRDEESEAV